MWIFGYGSLTWKVGFQTVERRHGYIDGWARRFWQDSIDHRGVPGSPGRVVTLVPDDASTVWGVAYRIDVAESDEILEALDFREKGGYERLFEPVYGPEGLLVEEALVYVATEENPNWGGPLDPAEIARVIHTAHGPSGSNVEYLIELAEALREIGAEDEHVFELERLVREAQS